MFSCGIGLRACRDCGRAGLAVPLLEETALASLEYKISRLINLSDRKRSDHSSPLDDQSDAITSVLEQVIGIIVPQVATVIVLDFCNHVSSE